MSSLAMELLAGTFSAELGSSRLLRTLRRQLDLGVYQSLYGFMKDFHIPRAGRR